MRRISLLAALVSLVVAVGCGGGQKARVTPTATARAIPSPVSVAQQPLGNFRLGDPVLPPLAGAKTDVGQLGGSIYQIEMPDQWNGRLVLYMHGCCGQDVLNIETVPDRDVLIQNGYAWGASSFSSQLYYPGTAADETAALWDHFVAKYGQPQRTYVMGVSMGGAAALIAAERYADRFDGALPLCASAGSLPHIGDWFGDFFVGGAFAAGVTQQQFDSTDIGELIYGTILPALKSDPAKRARFEALYTALSGGQRPLAREGLVIQESQLWDEAREDIGAGMFDNIAVKYAVDGVPGVSSDQFNAGAVRVKGGPLRDLLSPKEELTGKIQVPVYALHATGDAQNPLREEKLIRSLVDGAGKGDLLVQHAIRDPEHCGVGGPGEIYAAVEALASWVEDGRTPAGEDVLASDLTSLGVEHPAR